MLMKSFVLSDEAAPEEFELELDVELELVGTGENAPTELVVMPWVSDTLQIRGEKSGGAK
jgi:hypothetical protein